MLRRPPSLSSLWQRPYLLLASASAMWGGNTILSRIVAGEVSPMLMTFLRWGLVSLMVWPMAAKFLTASWPSVRPKLGKVIAMALLGQVANNMFIYLAAYHTSAVNMSIFQGATPIFVMAGAVMLMGIRTTWQQISGIVVALAGVMAIALKGDIQTLLKMSFNIGDIYMLISSASYAAYMLLLREKPAAPAVLFFAFLATFGALGSIPVTLGEYMSGALVWPSLTGWVIIVLVAIFPSLFAQMAFIRGVELIGPPRAGLFVNLIPVFGTVFAVVFLREALLPIHLTGLALVLAGIWLAERK